MGTILVNTTSAFSDGDQITSDSLNNLIDDAILNTTAVSAGTGLTVNGTTGVLSMDSSLTGKVLTGGSLNNAPIGASTPSTGAFTTLSSSSGYTGNVTGNVTGDVTGNLTGNVTGNISGNVTGGTGSFTTLTASGDVTFDTTTLKVDSTNNRVGIGTTSPAHKLSVSEASTDFAALITNSTSSGNGLKINAGDNSGDRVIELNDKDGNALMRVGATGLVGIGTESPSEKLHVKSSNSDTAETVAGFGNGDIDVGLEIKTNGNGGSSLDWGFNAVNSRHLVFDTNQTERMRIRSDGNVGINTDPSCKLDVNSGATNEVALFESTDETAYIGLADSTGSVQFITYSSGALRIATGGAAGGGSVGTSALFIDQSQDVGIGDDTPSYKLDVNGTGRFVGQLTLDDEVLHNISGTQTRLPGYYAGTYGLEIEQTAQGSTIHIGRSNGNCMNIGADAPASPTQLAVVYFRDTSTGIGSSPQASNPVGNISITDSTIHFNSTSDYRLKENEVDITDGIDRLKELKPYRFNFTRNPSKVVDGFFAHEVSSVVPESISGEKDQVDDEGNPVYQGIDQSKLVPLLTAALQEAVAKIEALEARVQTLEG
jgi:hypothetical protein